MATSGKHRANAWQATIARASADRDSGSWSITTLSAEGLAAAAVEGEPALRAAIALLLAGQPSMAALRNLANTTAWAWTGAPRGAGGAGHARAEGGAAAAARAARAFVERGDAAARAAAACAADVLRQEQARRAVTISASSVVEAALAAWRGPVLALESRPRYEGRALAQRLAAAGTSVTIAVDAAARVLLAPGDAVLLGADSVSPDGISNKIGSWALAAAARDGGLPVYALAPSEKWWPTALSDHQDTAGSGNDTNGRDPREVLPDPLAGGPAGAIEVWNPYFEPVSFGLLTALIAADGRYAPDQVRAALAQWRIHPWLVGR